MHKKRLAASWKHFLANVPQYLFALCIVFGTISALSMRENYQHMTILRQQVYTADEEGGDVEKALQNLRSYVTGHMNTSLTAGSNGVYPPIQLKYTYERLAQAAGQQTSNSQVYADAQQYCEGQIPTGFSGRVRLDCIEAYVAQHGSIAAPTVPDSLYKFDFASPVWSPDIAGLSLVVSLLSLAGLVIIVGTRKATRRFTA